MKHGTRPPTPLHSRLLGATFLLAAALIYVLAVLTPVGQHIDWVTFEGRKSQPVSIRHALTPWLTPAAGLAAAALVALTTVAVARGSRSVGEAARTMLGVAAAVGAATALKALLVRPDLVDHPYLESRNTLPSGHAAGVMAVAIGIAATPTSDRQPWRTVTLLGLAAFVVILVGAGWHRPADVLSGLLVGAASMTIIAARSSTDAPGTETWSRYVSLGIIVAAITLAFALRNTPPDPRHNFMAHIVGLVVMLVASTELLRRATSSIGRVPQDDSTSSNHPLE